MAINEKYSHKDFTHKILTDTKPEEWDDTEVVNSCFYNETPKIKVFPEGIKNVTFVRCNLDNVIIPPDCIVEDCSTRLSQVQNDMEAWILDKDLNPVEPVLKTMYLKLGLSIDPHDIPLEKLTHPITVAKRLELESTLQATIKAAETDSLVWRK